MEPIVIFQIVLLLLVMAAYAIVVAHLYKRFRKLSPGPVRSLTAGVLVIALLVFMAGIQRMVTFGGDAELVGPGVVALVDMIDAVVVVGAVAAFGIWMLIRLGSILHHLELTERMVMVLTERADIDTSVSEWGLTARELEVLEVIVSGKTSDDEIGDELFISPATAGTHVRNILRKAKLKNRHELMLLGAKHAKAA